jgi:short subunit dehydrogenase-like uncharacterized protein
VSKWVIYGATGYAGKRVAAEAVKRGLTPILAGRSKTQLEEVGHELGLETRCFTLDEPANIRASLADIALLVNAAGPFTFTASALCEACITTGTNYIDITGEMDVLSASFELNTAAKEAGVLIVSGAGFDVVPSDCLAMSLANSVNSPVRLFLALIEGDSFSKGSVATFLRHVSKGFFCLRNNHLIRIRPGTMCMDVDLGFQRQYLMPFPWGDLITAKESTGIENITTYSGCSRMNAVFSRVLFPVLGLVYKSKTILSWRLERLNNNHRNPTEEELSARKTYVWGRVENEAGDAKDGLLETPDGYTFTDISVVEAAILFLEGKLDKLSGALTPTQAFGLGFAESLPGVKRVY